MREEPTLCRIGPHPSLRATFHAVREGPFRARGPLWGRVLPYEAGRARTIPEGEGRLNGSRCP